MRISYNNIYKHTSFSTALTKVDRFPQPYAEQETRAGGLRTRQPVITKLIDLHLLDDTYAGITKVRYLPSENYTKNVYLLTVFILVKK